MHTPLRSRARPAITALLLLLGFASPAGAAPPGGPAYGSALPRFARFGWVSPPRESTTLARYTEMAEAGFNLTLMALDEAGTAADNRIRLDVSQAAGIGNLILDNDLDSVFVDDPESLVLADSIVARYRHHPAFLGYYLGDEPPATFFPRLGEWFGILRERDPAHPAWNSIGPRGAFATPAAFEAYVRQYVAATQPAVLCNNQYDFTIFGDSRFLTENISTLGLVARENGIPFWGVIQLVEHFIFRHVTEGMLRWQVAQWLAWGATGIGYFTYWTPSPNAEYDWQPAMIEWGTGRRTAYYDMVRALNGRLAPMGDTLATFAWRATRHSGSVPPGGVPFAPDSVLLGVQGRATLGHFVDAAGRPALFVGSADSAFTRTILLTLAPGWRALNLRHDGSAWDTLAVTAENVSGLAFTPGNFALLRLVRPAVTTSAPPAAAAPRLRAWPNPAHGHLRFAAAPAEAHARLELLDVAGRVVWSRAWEPGVREMAWDGSRDDGGRAGDGVYFARLRTAHGTSVRRVAWFGAR